MSLIWILTAGSSLLLIGALGAATGGYFHDAGTTTFGVIFFVVLFGICNIPLARRLLRRRTARKTAARSEPLPADVPPNPDPQIQIGVTEWSTGPRQPSTARNEARRAFFERVFATLSTTYPAIRPPRVQPANWCSFASGPFGSYALTFSKQGYRVEVYLDTGDFESTKQLFDQLVRHRHELHERLGFELTWERLDNNRASRIASYLEGFDLESSLISDQEAAATWTAQRVQALHQLLDAELRRQAAAARSSPASGQSAEPSD